MKTKIYVVVLRDGDCYGVSQPMNEKESDDFYDSAHKYGYDTCTICLDDLFKDGHQDLDVCYN